jgi:tRNA(Ile)-lysidine synthase
MRLVRGSGPAGLAGIPPRRPIRGGALEVVRPVLSVDPARLRAYAVARSLPFRDDPTNATLDRDRARVRARLEALGERSAALTRRLGEAAERFRARLARQEAEVSARLAPSLSFHAEAGAVEAAAEAVASLPAPWVATAMRVLGRPLAADREGPWFTSTHARLAHALASGPARHAVLSLPRGLALHRAGDRLLLARRDVAAPAPSLVEGTAGTWRVGGLRVRREERSAAAFDLPAWERERRAARPGVPPWRAAFDADRLGARLAIRAARPGDRFLPLGRCGDASVLEFLAKQGVPEVLRRAARVAVAGDSVVWVLGWRIDARYAVNERTRRVAVVEA